jgi:hypothetical protein
MGAVPIVVMNHLFESLAGPVVLAFDLRITGVHVWVVQIHTCVQNGDLNRRQRASLQRFLYELLVDLLEVTFPAQIFYAPRETLVNRLVV